MKPSSEPSSLTATSLVAGSAVGKALMLDEPLSFWGGFDPRTGSIVDVHHPQHGACVTNSILFIPESRGSAGTPGGIAETIRLGTGPLAFVLGNRDLNIAVGAMVSNRLYGRQVPVLQVPVDNFACFNTGDDLEIAIDGKILVVPNSGVR